VIDKEQVKQIHKFCRYQRNRLEASEQVGCFYCETVFKASEIESWCDERDQKECTAMCPECGIDSIIGMNDAVKNGVAENEFLELLHKMNLHWF
jgi:hypothetical protein